MGSAATLETVYEEVKTIRRMLEEMAEASLRNVLPEIELAPKVKRESEQVRAEMERGEYVTLKEVKRRILGLKT